MATNINFSSPEVMEGRSFSGKSALIIAVALLAFVTLTYAGLIFMGSRYAAQQKEVEAEIIQEQNKAKGPEFTDALDFQDRLNLLEKTIGDHSYWDGLLVKMGSYVIPEVRLESFSGKTDPLGGGEIEISGVANSLDALSRELILLKDFPGLDSLEFKGASERTEQGGISFSASLKVNNSVFQK